MPGEGKSAELREGTAGSGAGAKISDADLLKEATRMLGNDSTSLADALPAIYNDLRRLAGSYLRGERPNHTLQPTALVHEAYLKLCRQRNVDWGNREQFVAVAAKLMRRILLDHAIAHGAAKRGGGDGARVSFDAVLQVFDRQEVSAIALNEVLESLEAVDPRQAQVVELRFFGGLSVPEIGNVLNISPATVKREWSVAKLWLERELSTRG
ncbi:MAG TPA: ECF-type sigma factor [Chthoniobacterales bacterium]|jgi:RNA polymerase sigma factor (TIGR02999 family)|nr:ECF-type sigma factor [Chthoniobacterales bacterium]